MDKNGLIRVGGRLNPQQAHWVMDIHVVYNGVNYSNHESGENGTWGKKSYK